VSTIPAHAMTEETPWLSEKQQRVWRSWLTMNAQLPGVLHRQLQNDSGLSLQDFEVLVHLSEVDGGRLRISQLASAMGWERSRLSHHFKRMEARGLVERGECPEDARGAFVVLTPTGREAIERAAPGHARTVRDLVFDTFPDHDLDVLARFTEAVLRRLETADQDAGSSPDL
jgi:DNA-binding MarR family transcriptional regulator